ncbi:type II toxin-antitoxin system RelE family toxin [Aerococcus christensenii]
MSYKLAFIKEALNDYQKLDGSQRILVDKALKRILLNPLPQQEGGYGKPLANRFQTKLTGLMKVKLKRSGLRIIYRLERHEYQLLVIIIGARADSQIYKEAQRRIAKQEI